jgi:hypothetical protein
MSQKVVSHEPIKPTGIGEGKKDPQNAETERLLEGYLFSPFMKNTKIKE